LIHVPLPAPDYGEVQQPGLLGRLFGRPPKIVREADFAAALATLPEGVLIVATDPSGNWIVFKMPDGSDVIRFRASAAWFPNEPTLVGDRSPRTLATVLADGKVVVFEGLHRTRAMARERSMIDNRNGGLIKAPGWLDFTYDSDALHETPSSIAIGELLGGNPESDRLIPAK
jgi:hypothetical protein